MTPIIGDEPIEPALTFDAQSGPAREPPPAGDLITLAEAAKLTPYGQEYISLLARKGKLLAWKQGRNWFTTKVAVLEYVSKQVQEAEAEYEKKAVYSLGSAESQVLLPAPAAAADATQSAVTAAREIANVLGETLGAKFDSLREGLREVGDKVSEAAAQQPQVVAAPAPYTEKPYRPRKPLLFYLIILLIVLPLLFAGLTKGVANDLPAKLLASFKNAWTLDGHRAGTNANEVLILNEAGNISIKGHIETEGQLRSYARDGVAPIIVDSSTKVENFNADTVDGFDPTQFTLAFVTKNGNVTTDDVYLKGAVEVGGILEVKGATKLLDALLVDGNLGVWGEAFFHDDVTVDGNVDLKQEVKVGGGVAVQQDITVGGDAQVKGGATIGGPLTVGGPVTVGGDITTQGNDLNLGNGTIHTSSRELVKNLNAELWNGRAAGDFDLDYVTDNGAVTGNKITVGGLDVNGPSQFFGRSIFKDAAFFEGNLTSIGRTELTGDTFISNLTLEDLKVDGNTELNRTTIGGTLQVNAHAFIDSANVSGNLSSATFGVGGEATIGSDTRDNLTVESTSLFKGSVTANRSLTLTSATPTINSTVGPLTLQSLADSATGNVQIGSGGAGSTTPDLLVVDIKSNAGDPTGTEGAIYYNDVTNKFRCFEGGAWSDCVGAGGAMTLQGAYDGGNAITTTTARDIAFTLADTAVDSNFVVNVADGSTSTAMISRANGTGTADPAQLLLLDNLDLNRSIADGLRIQSAAGLITDGIDASDAELVNALNVGDNSIVGTTPLIDLTNFDVDASGNVISAGDVAVNGGDLTTTSATFNLVNAGATTVNFAGAGSAVNIGPGGATASSLNLVGGSGATGCTADGATGNFTCSGNITSTGGTAGFWQRVVTTLSPATAGDAVTTSGNMSTTGAGTITSAGLLIASNGLTQTTGALNLTATSGALTLSGLGVSSISTGANSLTFTASNFNTTATGINSTAIGATTASTGVFTTLSSSGATNLGTAGASAVNIATTGTGSVTVGNATGTFQLTSNGGLNVSTAGALTGVSSLDTISTSATALGFAGAGAISTGAGTNLALDAGTTGVVNIASTSTGDVNLAGGSGVTGCTVTNSNGNLTCSGNIIGGATGTAGYWTRSGTTLSPATAGDAVTTSGNISTSGTGIITSAGLLTASNGLTQTTGALSLTGTSGSIALTGFGSIAITSTNTTTNAFALTDTALTTASLALLTSSNNSGADTAWAANKFVITNAQGTTAVSTGSIAGLDVQFTQGTSIAGNNETVARLNVAQNDSASTDLTVDSILALANNDTGAGNQIVVTDGLKISGANITNGLNLSGTFGTNLITSTNFQVTQAGAVTAVGVNSGTGLIQGTGGLTVTGTTNINTSGSSATNIGTGTGSGAVAIATGTGNLTLGNATGTFQLTSNGGLNVSTAGALTGVSSLDTISTSATALGFAGAGAISTGAGTNLALDAGTTGVVNIASTSTGDVNLAGGSGVTGCTVTNSNGNLTCSGNIIGGATGTAGYWTRSGTTLSTATAGDAVTVDGTLTANGNTVLGNASGDTLSIFPAIVSLAKEINHTISVAASTTAATAGGALNILSGAGNGAISGAVTLASAAAVLDSGGNSGAVTITSGDSLGDPSGTTGNLVLKTGAGGVDSTSGNITIDVGAAVIKGTISLGSTNANTLNIGNSSGASTLNIGTGAGGNLINIAGTGASGVDVINIGTGATGADTISIGTAGTVATSIVMAGGSGDTGCTLAGATGNLTCSGNIIGGATGTAGYWTRSGTTLSPATANDVISVTGNTGNILTLTSSATGASNTALNISQTGATGGTDYGAFISNTGAATTNVGLYTTASGATNNYAAIFEAGNVGIGTITPTARLHVFSFDILVDADGTTTIGVGTPAAISEGATLVDVEAADNLCTNSLTAPTHVRVDTTCGTTGDGTIVIADLTTGTTQVTSAWAFQDTVVANSAYDSGEDLYIDNAVALAYQGGGTGLGSTDTTSRLHVGANNAAPETLSVRSFTNASLQISGDTDNGSGEIGTAYALFSQDGGGVQGILGTVQFPGQDSAGGTYTGTLNNATLLGTLDANGALQFGTNDLVRMTIEAGAHEVGIATTVADAALEINSAAGDNLRLTYNDADGAAANFADFGLSSSGDLSIDASGGDVNIAANDNLSLLSGTGQFSQTHTSGGASTTFTITSNASGGGNVEPITFRMTHAPSAAADGYVGLDFEFNQNPTVAGNTETGMRVLLNADAQTTDNAWNFLFDILNNDNAVTGSTIVTDGISVRSTTDNFIINGLNVSDAELTNSINVGANPIVSSGSDDITINPAGGQLLLADADTIIIGGHAGAVAYNVIANSGEAPEDASITSDNDLYIGGDLEVDGAIIGAGPASGTSGFWTRSSTTLSPATTNDLVSISSNTTTGTVLSLTASAATTGYALSASTTTTTATAGTNYNLNLSLSDTGVVTTGTDTTYGVYNSVTRTGATTSAVVNTYGGYFTASGDNAGAGTHTVYGLYATVAGSTTVPDSAYAIGGLGYTGLGNGVAGGSAGSLVGGVGAASTTAAAAGTGGAGLVATGAVGGENLIGPGSAGDGGNGGDFTGGLAGSDGGAAVGGNDGGFGIRAIGGFVADGGTTFGIEGTGVCGIGTTVGQLLALSNCQPGYAGYFLGNGTLNSLAGSISVLRAEGGTNMGSGAVISAVTRSGNIAFSGRLIEALSSAASAGTTRYGVYSSMTGAGTGTTTNIAGYFNSQNATNNYGLIVDQGSVGIGDTTPDAKLDIDSVQTSGTILGLAAPSAVTLGGALTGFSLNVNTNYTPGTNNVTGQTIAQPVYSGMGSANSIGLSISSGALTVNTVAGLPVYKGALVTLPSVTNTDSANLEVYGYDAVTPSYTQTTAKITNFRGYSLSTAGALVQNTAAGTINWTGGYIKMPNITQTTGAVIAQGFEVATGTITTAGTQRGINVNAAGVGAGTLTGILVSGITAAAGAETGLDIGGGWDTSIAIGTSDSNTTNNATVTVGNVASTAQNNRTNLIIQNAGTGFLDLELVRGFVNNQGINTFQDDFVGKTLDATNVWTNAAATGAATCSSTFQVGVVGGVVRQTTGTTNPGACNLSTQVTLTNGFFQRGNNPTFEAAVKMGTGGAGVRAFFGFVSAAVATGSDTLAAGSHAAMIEKRAADTNWFCVTMDGTTETRTDIGVAVSTTAFQRLRVTVQNGTTPQVICSVDTTAISKTTNMPGATSAMDMYLKTETSDTTSETNDIDYVRSWQDDPPELPAVLADGSLSVGRDLLISRADVAENYQAVSGANLTAGELVAVLPSGQVNRSTTPYDGRLIGIVSTEAYQVIGRDDFQGVVRVALAGRVPVKVSGENGAIAVGDYLTSSSISGVAMKASQRGLAVGMALEAFSGTGIGEVLVFVNRGQVDPSVGAFTDTSGAELISVLKVAASGAKLSVDLVGTASVEAPQTLFDVKFNGEDRFRVLENGDVSLAGTLAAASVKLGSPARIGGTLLGGTVAEGFSGLLLEFTKGARTLFAVDGNGVLQADSVKTRALVIDNQDVPRATIGGAVIPAGSTLVTIAAPEVRPGMKIFLTPKLPLSQSLAVTNIQQGNFTVALAYGAASDVPFDWWVVDVTNPSLVAAITESSGPAPAPVPSPIPAASPAPEPTPQVAGDSTITPETSPVVVVESVPAEGSTVTASLAE